MRKLVLTLAASLTLLLVACGGDDDGGDTTATPTTAASGQPTATSGAPGECTDLEFPITAGELGWTQVLPDMLPDLGEYSVEDTEGDAPLISVLQEEGEVIGTIELLQFPTEGNVDTTKSAAEGLQEWSEGFYASVETERENAGGTFEGDDPVEAFLGEACGVRYGYTVTDDGDDVIERYVGYVTHDGDRMFLFVAIYDAVAAAEQGFGSAVALQGFEPEFETLMASLDIPPG
jgi:hypothetical protein